MSADRHVARDVRGERRLADARSRRDHDEVAGLQPRREVVEVAEPRRQPRVCRIPVLDVLQIHHGLIDQVAQDGHLVGILATGHVVDPLFRIIGHALGVGRSRVRHVHDVRRRADQPSEQRGLRDDARVVLRGGGGRHLLDQVAHVERTADVFEDSGALQRFDAGDDVDGLASGVEPAQDVVDPPVDGSVEIVGLHDLDDVGDGLGREHHGAEDRFLGLEVLGRHARVAPGDTTYVFYRARQDPHPSPSIVPWSRSAPPVTRPVEATLRPGNFHWISAVDCCTAGRGERFLVTPALTCAFPMWTSMWTSVNHTSDIRRRRFAQQAYKNRCIFA